MGELEQARSDQLPKSIQRALYCLAAAILVEFVSLVLQHSVFMDSDALRNDKTPALFLLVYGLEACFAAFVFFLIWRISKRANWARILMVVVVVISAYTHLGALSYQIREMPVIAILSIVLVTLFVVGVLSLFGKSSSSWFKLKS